MTGCACAVLTITTIWFSPSGLAVAQQTVQRCLEKVSRLYEQGADAIRIGKYVRRWLQWVRSGVDGELLVGDVSGLVNGSLCPDASLGRCLTLSNVVVIVSSLTTLEMNGP